MLHFFFHALISAPNSSAHMHALVGLNEIRSILSALTSHAIMRKRARACTMLQQLRCIFARVRIFVCAVNLICIAAVTT